MAEPTPAAAEDASRATDRQARSRLISSGALMAAGTAVSRVLGFGRFVLLVILFGNGTRQAEMFTLANTVPNSMYILLAGGVLNTVLVPQIVRAVKKDADGGEAYTNRIMTLGLIALFVITLVLTLAAPAIIAVYSAGRWKIAALSGPVPVDGGAGLLLHAPGVLLRRLRAGRSGAELPRPVRADDVGPDRQQRGLHRGAAAVPGHLRPDRHRRRLHPRPGGAAGDRLHARGRCSGRHPAALPALVGYHFQPRLDFRRTGLGQTLRLAKWVLGYVLVTQLALVVVTKLATAATIRQEGGGIAAYGYAYAIWILPHSLITVSLATAMLPSASRLAAAGDLKGVAEEATRTMRLALSVLVPTSVAFVVLGLPIAQLIFGFGRGAADWQFTGWALMALGVGLVPFTLQYVCLRAFYALENTRTPFFLQVVIAAANVVLGAGLVVALDSPPLVAPRSVWATRWRTSSGTRSPTPAAEGPPRPGPPSGPRADRQDPAGRRPCGPGRLAGPVAGARRQPAGPRPRARGGWAGRRRARTPGWPGCCGSGR